MAKSNSRAKRSTLIKRIGFYSALAAVMLLVLAACGTADTTGSATGSNTSQAATATTEATAVAIAEPTSTVAGAEPTATAEGATITTGDAPTATVAADTAAQSGGGTTVQGTLREWAIDLSTHEVAAGKITFVVTNEGQMAHNFTILSDSGTVAKTPNFRSSQGEQTLEVELQPGTYTIICDLPGHAQRGQKTELVVK